MKTVIDFFQETVGATYPIDTIVNNLEKEDIVEMLTEYNKFQKQEKSSSNISYLRIAIWNRLVKSLSFLNDNNFTARKLYDYIDKQINKTVYGINAKG